MFHRERMLLTINSVQTTLLDVAGNGIGSVSSVWVSVLRLVGGSESGQDDLDTGVVVRIQDGLLVWRFTELLEGVEWTRGG